MTDLGLIGKIFLSCLGSILRERTCLPLSAHTFELSYGAARLYHMTIFAFGTRKFVLSHSNLENCPIPRSVSVCTPVPPDSEAMIHEGGFHSVLFFSIYNTKCQLLLLCITYAFVGRTVFVCGCTPSHLPTHNEIWLALGLFYEWGEKTGTSLEDSAWF